MSIAVQIGIVFASILVLLGVMALVRRAARSMDLGAEVQRDPAYWTNRIHRDDAARLIVHLLRCRSGKTLFVGVDHRPVPMWEVCCWLARQLEAPDPVAVSGNAGNKRISNARVLDAGFEFRFPDYRSGYGQIIAARRAVDC